jgi:hypothetical protein
MTVQLDQGIHRHLRFAKPGTNNMYFNLNTWPGFISITGDMGDYVFQRTNDMFEFMRDSNMQGKINQQYWAEKVVAESTQSPRMQFSNRKFREATIHASEDWETTLKEAPALQAELENDVYTIGFSNEHEAYEFIQDYITNDGRHFEDFDYSLKEYGYHYTWCLRAIVWGIKQYDLLKEDRTQADYDRRVLAGEL